MSGSTTLPSVFEFDKPINEAEAPVPLPAREYRATVKAIEARVSKNSGKPMAAVSYSIPPEQYPVDYTDGDPDGTTLTYYVQLEQTPRNMYRLRKFCEMHGVVATRTLNLVDFMGTEVIVKVEHEDYQGAPQARVTPVREV